MSSPPDLLKTDQQQIYTHDTIITIGEALRHQYDDLAEDKRQRTIRSVQEVVRREEEAKTEKKLSSAKSDWLKERQQLFQEAHQAQLRAIARQSSILETSLRKEFAETLEQTAEEHKEHVAREVQSTWDQAQVIKKEAVDVARQEEKERATEEARQVAEQVSMEMRENKEQAERDKCDALAQQREQMLEDQSRALDKQRQELEQQFHDRLSTVSTEYETRLTEVNGQLEEQRVISKELEDGLSAMTVLKESWETKYSNIKAEFSDFIDHVPGFRGEFVLK